MWLIISSKKLSIFLIPELVGMYVQNSLNITNICYMWNNAVKYQVYLFEVL